MSRNRERGEAQFNGIGVLGLLGVSFVLLKILDVKPVGDWSWWWVTAPFWSGFALVLGVAGAYVLLLWVTRR